MEKPPTAGVTVEYSDPSGIYHLLACELNDRLPLKGLHWSNSSGFIRTIDNLYIELVPDDSLNQPPKPTSFDGPSVAQGNGPITKSEGPKKERRHQFPGLRRTPYLKVYLLQCADVDTYRASSRKLLRDWVRDHTPSAQSSSQLNKQENHDAFEWLIVHVLPPSTEGTVDIKCNGNAEKRSTMSRWPSRSSSSVIEKIRADFNGTSKNAADRVAQIQLTERPKDDSVQVKQQSQGDQDGWGDLSAKLKSLILASFGLRVSQYEEDIKEKEMQRNLPGWNFNTFFVLKEGLAIGFENMGLLEDALTVYRELAVGLAVVIDGQEDNKDDNQQTTRFSQCTNELKVAFEQAVTASRRDCHQGDEETGRTVDLGTLVLVTDRKPFRNLILESNISVFDFQSYVFARQMIILLRLANGVVPKPASSKDTPLNGIDADTTTSAHLSNLTQNESVNLIILAEATELSIEFIASVAQIVREDIENAVKQSSASHDEDEGILDVIKDNLTSSWTFSACQCILEATAAASLSKQTGPLLRQLKPKTISTPSHGKGQAADVAHRNDLPARTSSLPPHLPKPKSPPQETFPLITSLDATQLLPPGSNHVGIPELAAQRGGLLALERRVLSNIGLRHHGWQAILADIVPLSKVEQDNLEDVELDDRSVQENGAVKGPSSIPKVPTTAGIYNRSILSALESKNNFYATYEDLTISALASYVIGDRKKTAEAMTADLAVIKFQLEDYNVAASYFRQLAPFYAKDEWSELEIVILNMYAECLSHLERTEDYVRIALRTLAKIIRSSRRVTTRFQTGSPELLGSAQILSYRTVTLEDIIAASDSLEQPISVPMEQFFDNIRPDHSIHHSPDHDGFTLLIRLRSLLPGDLEARSIRVRLISVGEEQQSELWLSPKSIQMIRPGTNNITLNSTMMLPGWYTLGDISIQSANLIFVVDVAPGSSAPLLTRPRYSMIPSQSNAQGRPRLLIWPAPRSFEVCVKNCEEINLELPRSINVEVSSGKNEVSKGKLLLRAASAGLRLHTAKTVVQSGEMKITDQTRPGTITFDRLQAGTTACIRLPYSVETDLKDIVVRVEVTYTTSEGDFICACNSMIPILLPLAINVQDIFKQNMLFSRFTIGTVTSVPLRIFNCHLEGNDNYQIDSPPLTGTALDVFDLQPLSFVSKIQMKSDRQDGTRKSESVKSRLYLRIEYRCLDEEIVSAVENLFSTALDTSSFNAFSRILKPTLSAILRKTFSVHRLEVSGLQRDFNMGTFNEHEWMLPLSGLANDQGESLAAWLKSWHEDHQTIRLEQSAVSSPMQYLSVPVDVPQVQVLHTVCLKQSHSVSAETRQDTVPIGEGVSMELVISYTRYWDSAQRQRPGDEALDFCYELQSNSDWLVGGQRKGHYRAREEEVLSFSLLLWPQRTGNLLLPAIDIHSIPHSGGEGSMIVSEIDYRDQSRTILVVSDLLRTTVNLDPSGASGSWLVESLSRSV